MAFLFRLEHEDGAPVDPPTLRTAVPNWRAGDTIPFPGPLEVVVVKDPDGDQPPTLVVRDAAESAPSGAA